MTSYVFAGEGGLRRDQEDCLAAAYDPVTTARLASTGVADGWHCLEIGAGGGSVACWLADRVAPGGDVVATDLVPQHVPEARGLTAVRHDVVADPLPGKAFDLVHTRLVLRHLPAREAVLDKLLATLTPGGWLQVDEFDTTYQPCLAAPDSAAERLFREFLAAKDAVMAKAGVDVAWGSRVGAAMRRAGFVEVDVRPRIDAWRPGSAGTRLLAHHTYRLRDELLAAGMTDDGLRRVRALLADPDFLVCSSVFYSVQGRRAR
ncbi:class I SAM-dependent methyltransferase [Amycolatopsis sp. CA-230715]|uniref:class I SAM-dependent methyltransferase n=1 Tax=Amycolatopsis sp. CA-230715 TaxID=2745196 RepID=UPI001C01BA4B|nr:class I SAM-dependent methyltransferase [Amycolatopsis sp. CA-230715]QWF83853.1 hypothetical protein HUW46_07296 [Amycolatopsis sp. CA-230715]